MATSATGRTATSTAGRTASAAGRTSAAVFIVAGLLYAYELRRDRSAHRKAFLCHLIEDLDLVVTLHPCPGVGYGKYRKKTYGKGYECIADVLHVLRDEASRQYGGHLIEDFLCTAQVIAVCSQPVGIVRYGPCPGLCDFGEYLSVREDIYLPVVHIYEEQSAALDRKSVV